MTDMNDKCPLCESDKMPKIFDSEKTFRCKYCGDYCLKSKRLMGAVTNDEDKDYDINKLKSYLFFHPRTMENNTFWYIGSQKAFEKYKLENFQAVYLSYDEIENWYPKTFSEKIDQIMLKLFSLSSYYGEEITLNLSQMKCLFFIENNKKKPEIQKVIKFIKSFFVEEKLLIYNDGFITADVIPPYEARIILLPKALSKVYELQKNDVNNKDVFVAMKYKDNDKLYEAIRKGIANAGYNAIRLDKEEYLGHMIPEMLHKIRQAKFMVVDYSDGNQGAYFESGYAYGLSKKVIPICREDMIGTQAHFDIKQINTITYSSPEKDLVDKLEKRIRATIE